MKRNSRFLVVNLNLSSPRPHLDLVPDVVGSADPRAVITGNFSASEPSQNDPRAGTRAMGVAYAEATLVACSSVGGGDGVPGRTSLYREVCELERRVRAVDHMTSLARLARGSDAMDDEREKAFAREEPCLGRARELLEVSDDLASAETAVLAWEGVRAASRVAESGDAEELETAAETATRLETALRRVATRFHDPRRPEGPAETRNNENERAHVMCAKALDALHAAAHALRAAAAERGARAKMRAEKKNVPEKKRPETGDEFFSFSRLAPRLAATCGRWSRAHAAMGAELRGKNPLESAFRGFREDAGDSENDDDEATSTTFSGEDVKTSPRRDKKSRDAPSEWARHAMAACRVVTEAASEALCTRETDHDHDHDGESVRVVHIAGGSSTRHPHAESNEAALTPLLADLLLRTARAVLNFAAHQPRLWPKSRTLLQMCAARRDAEAVDEAVAACVKVFEEAYVSRVRKEKENDHLVFSDEFSLTRALVVARRALAHSRAGVSSLTEGVASCVRRACAEAYETAPTGSWSSRKVLGNAKKSAGTGGSIACFSASADDATRTNAISDADANANKSAFLSGLGTPSDVSRTRPSSQTSLVVDQILTPLFVSLDRLGDGSLAKRTKSVCVAHAGAAALDALLSRVRAEGNGGVRLFSGGAERLEADVELIIVAVEAFLFSATKKQKQKEKQKEKETSLSLSNSFRAAAKRGRAVVAVAKAAGTAASSAKGQAYAAARAALGAEEAETWRKVCVK